MRPCAACSLLWAALTTAAPPPSLTASAFRQPMGQELPGSCYRPATPPSCTWTTCRSRGRCSPSTWSLTGLTHFVPSAQATLTRLRSTPVSCTSLIGSRVAVWVDSNWATGVDFVTWLGTPVSTGPAAPVVIHCIWLAGRLISTDTLLPKPPCGAKPSGLRRTPCAGGMV